MKLRVFNIIKNTKVEGPGNRYCIWVQGCSRHCIGCQAVHTWAHDKGELYEVNDIINDILQTYNKSKTHIKDKDSRIEGVTFLGGEPFEQAEALGIIAREVKKAGLSIVCFTGDYLENLKLKSKNKMLIDNIDLLIDGPYEKDKTDYSRPWCGSSNQRYHFLTDRYNEDIFLKHKNKVEVNISTNGQILINGMGNFDDIQQKVELIGLKK